MINVSIIPYLDLLVDGYENAMQRPSSITKPYFWQNIHGVQK